MERKKIIPTFKELKADLKTMTFPQKLDHLWTYYKYHVLIAAVVLVFVAAIISGIVNASKEVLVSGMLTNVSMKQSGFHYLSDGYGEVLGAKGNQVVELTSTNFEDLETSEDVEANYNAAQVLIARVSGGLMDYAIIDQMSFEFYLTQDVYLDLRELFTQEELQRLADADMLAYAKIKETEQVWPVAVKITNWDFTKENVKTKGEIYFIVSGNSPDLEAVRGILEHMHNWE